MSYGLQNTIASPWAYIQPGVFEGTDFGSFLGQQQALIPQLPVYPRAPIHQGDWMYIGDWGAPQQYGYGPGGLPQGLPGTVPGGIPHSAPGMPYGGAVHGQNPGYGTGYGQQPMVDGTPGANLTQESITPAVRQAYEASGIQDPRWMMIPGAFPAAEAGHGHGATGVGPSGKPLASVEFHPDANGQSRYVDMHDAAGNKFVLDPMQSYTALAQGGYISPQQMPYTGPMTAPPAVPGKPQASIEAHPPAAGVPGYLDAHTPTGGKFEVNPQELIGVMQQAGFVGSAAGACPWGLGGGLPGGMIPGYPTTQPVYQPPIYQPPVYQPVGTVPHGH